MKTKEAVTRLEETGERRRSLGELSVLRDGKRGRLPLAAVSIRAAAAYRVAEVTLAQSFANPLAEPLEAVYTFPLPGGAAVRRCELKVAGRTIAAKLKERGEAREDYERALAEGKRAALLEQDRGDVFTLQVGNLPPGETAEVTIVYSEALPYLDDGTAELRLPLVVAPRYVPGRELEREPVGAGVEWDTDRVPDASRISPPRLAPGFDPKVALSIEVELQGAPEDLACSQHAVRSAGGMVKLSNTDELLDRDFVLRWRLAEDGVRPTLLRTKSGYAMLTLVAPPRKGFTGLARDVVFLLDRSGSMQGPKMVSASRACSILLRSLSPRDRFAICAFDNAEEWFGKELLAADEEGLARGEGFLRAVEARGGTELGGGLAAALRLLGPGERPRAGVVVVITDGQVGQEAEILRLAQKELGGSRVFTVGIDTAVNEAFLRRLAELGGGTSTCCAPGAALEEALAAVAREVGEPLVTGLSLEGAEEPAPERLPDLFAGRAVTVFVRAKGPVTLAGRWADGKAFSATVKPKPSALAAVEHLWAKARIADLEDRFRLGEAVRARLIELSLEHSVLCRFTAYVAVDERAAEVRPEDRRTLVQPVQMPARWAGPRTFAAACAPASADMLGGDSMAKELGSGGAYLKEAVVNLDKAHPGPKRTRADVFKLIVTFRKELEEARRTAASGRRPRLQELLHASSRLRSALQQWDAAESGKLRRLLQRPLWALVRALDASSTPPEQAAELIANFLAELDQAKDEGGADFWSATV